MRGCIISLTFMLAVTLTAADKSAPAPVPPLRSRAEVEAALSRSPISTPIRPLNLVLVASAQDHGPGEHDSPAWQKKWNSLLSQAAGVTVTNAWKWPGADQFTHADVLVFYCWNHSWTDEVYKQLDSFLARGGGVVLLHSSSIADT